MQHFELDKKEKLENPYRRDLVFLVIKELSVTYQVFFIGCLMFTFYVYNYS